MRFFRRMRPATLIATLMAAALLCASTFGAFAHVHGCHHQHQSKTTESQSKHPHMADVLSDADKAAADQRHADCCFACHVTQAVHVLDYELRPPEAPQNALIWHMGVSSSNPGPQDRPPRASVLA
jgi:hypothetical protein